MKKSKKINRYLDLARELKRLCYIMVKMMLIVAGAFGTVSKGFERRRKKLEISEKIETIQITVLFTSTRILRRVQEI